MKKSLSLFLEINNFNFIFFVVENNEEGFKVNYKLITPLNGIEKSRISDMEKVSNILKENVYLIEQKFNYTFKEIILILENFNPTFLNISGFKKLDGSQIIRENITYIINTLKSCVSKNETKKNIIHIFNSNFFLDKKKIDNLPIGLFGDFYSHELSFNLINKNIFKNLERVVTNCNLKIKKILLKSFVTGACISDNNRDLDTFFKIKIGKKNSKIFYFENNSLKYEQYFEFGSNIIIRDISKITSLREETIETILHKTELNRNLLNEELIYKIFFNQDAYRKIKKRLLYDISFARIEEILDKIIFKNINTYYHNKISNVIFLEIEDQTHLNYFKEVFQEILKSNGSNFNFLDNFSDENMLKTANKLVHFGWKKEAIPITHFQKSIIARFFDAVFD